jgi:hypothetical protein
MTNFESIPTLISGQPTGWIAGFLNTDSKSSHDGTTFVICMTAPGPITIATYQISTTVSVPNAGISGPGFATLTPTCSTGDFSTGGGWKYNGPFPLDSKPHPDTSGGTPTGWYTQFVNTDVFSALDATATAVCMTPVSIDFELAVSHSSLTIEAGGSLQVLIHLLSINGFTGTVTVTAVQPIPGVTGSPSPQNIVLSPGGEGSYTLTVSVDPSVVPDNYSLDITATGTDQTTGLIVSESSSILVQVTGFSIDPSTPTTVPCDAGVSCSTPITITELNGFTGPVTLTPSSSPGLSCSPIASVTLPPSPASSPLSCKASTAADYHITVTGNSGPLSHTTATITYHVTDFTITAAPTSFDSKIGKSGNTTLTLTGLNGFTDTVHLSVKSITPTGPTATITLTSIDLSMTTTTSTSVVTVSIPHGITKDTSFTVIIQAQSSGLTHTVTLTVTAVHHIPK